MHINEPGRTDWEGFSTATSAAAAGGVTTLIEMPLNSIPATTTAVAYREKLAAAAGKLRVDMGFWGGVVPGNAAELPGVVGRWRIRIQVFSGAQRRGRIRACDGDGSCARRCRSWRARRASAGACGIAGPIEKAVAKAGEECFATKICDVAGVAAARRRRTRRLRC